MNKISVIIPIYNVEQYLKKCLDSIVNQTYKDIEIICVNDGSTDNSLQIIKEYAKADFRIKIIDKENGGQSSARNEGLKIANGEWISFIDSDDWLDIHAYEKLEKYFHHDPDIICFGTHMRGDVLKGDEKYYKIKYEGVITQTDDVRLSTDVAVCNKLWKKSIIDKYELTFPMGMHYEDAAFYWIYIFESKNAYYTKEKFYNYLRRPDSTMANTFNKTSIKAIDHLCVTEIIYDYLKKRNLLKLHIKTFVVIFVQYFWFAYEYSNKKYKKDVLFKATELLKKFDLGENFNNKNDVIKHIANAKYYKIPGVDYGRPFLQKLFFVGNQGACKIIRIFGITIQINNPSTILKNIKNTITDFVSQRGFVKMLFISAVVYFIALFALLRGDVYYKDDWPRALGENWDWNYFSRQIATFSYNAINVFKEGPYADISPLPQCLAIILLSISGLIMSYVIRKKIDVLGVIAALPLGLSPYYLEDLSFKYDSFTMSLSILFCVIPFLFKDRLKYFGLFSIIGIILSLSTYQASNSIYIVLSMYLAIAMYIFHEKSNKGLFKFILTALLSFIIGVVIYRYLIVTPTAVDYYANSVAMPLSQILQGGNTLTYLTYLYTDLRDMPFYILVIAAMFLFIVAMMINSRRKIYISFIISVIFLGVGLVLSYGAYLVLAQTIFEPRALIGFGGFVSIITIALLTIQHIKKLYFIHAIIVCLVGHSLIVFATAYGNAISKQQEYTIYRASVVAKDIADIAPKNQQVSIMLKGSIGYSPVTQNFINRYGQIAHRLIPVLMINSPLWWHTYVPIKYLGVNYDNYYGTDCELLKDDSKKPLILSNAFHDISRYKNCYIVELKNYK